MDMVAVFLLLLLKKITSMHIVRIKHILFPRLKFR